MPVQYGYAKTAAGQIHYRASGEGPSLVLLHHSPRSSDLYRECLPLLAGRFRAIAIDTVGFGGSFRPDAPPGIAGYAAAVVGVLDALGIERTFLYGFLTGSAIAAEVAGRYPERVAALSLGNCPDFEPDERERFLNTAPLNAIEDDGSHIARSWRGYAGGAYRGWGTAEQVQRAVVDSLIAGPVQAHFAHRAVAEQDIRQLSPGLAMPVLFLYSSAGPFADRQPMLAGLARAGRTLTIAECGPLIMQERPETFSAALGEFFAPAEPDRG